MKKEKKPNSSLFHKKTKGELFYIGPVIKYLRLHITNLLFFFFFGPLIVVGEISLAIEFV